MAQFGLFSKEFDNLTEFDLIIATTCPSDLGKEASGLSSVLFYTINLSHIIINMPSFSKIFINLVIEQ